MQIKKFQKFNLGKIAIIVIILISLIVSVLISMESITGYVISEHINTSANLLATGFFMIGIFGAVYYLTKLK